MTETGEKFDRINAIPAYQLVADAIEREILARRIRPGEPIGTEAQLVKQFGVNRSTVREGIRLLEQSGLIHRDSGRRLMATLPHYSRLLQKRHCFYCLAFIDSCSVERRDCSPAAAVG